MALDWVSLPEGIRAVRVKRVTYEREHEFKWSGNVHVGQGVKFQLENVDFGDLEELDEGQAWGGVFTFWQEVKGNGLWHKAMPDHDVAAMRSAGTFSLYTKYVRGLLGPEAGTYALNLARDNKWDWDLLVGTEAFCRIVHKVTDRGEYVNLAPFREMDVQYDIENPKSLFYCSDDQAASNRKLIELNVAREPGGEVPAERPVEKPSGPCPFDAYLKSEVLPVIRRVNEWDANGHAEQDPLAVAYIRWAGGALVDKLSLIGECRKHGGLPFRDLPEREKILLLSELIHALSCAGYEVGQPTDAMGGSTLWFSELARSVSVWSGYLPDDE